MEYRVLGPLEVLAGGVPLELGTPRQRAVLALLLTQFNRPISVDRLIDLLWKGEPPEQATATLHTYVSNLRRLLEPNRAPRARPSVVVTRAPGYAIEIDARECDASEFQRLAKAGHDRLRKDPAGALELLDRALRLWRGEAFADFGDESWARAERERLTELRLSCVEDRFDAALALGEHLSIVPDLVSLVGEHQERERLRGQLMMALYRSGRQAEALRVFDDGRRWLRDELGLDPGPELQRLHRAILAHEPELATPGPAGGVVRASPPGRAGSWEPSFIGRAPIMREVDAAIAESANGRGGVLVIEGERGSGKTRLLQAIAGRVEEAGGIALCGRCDEADTGPPLAPWPDLVRAALAHTGSSSLSDGSLDVIHTWAVVGGRATTDQQSIAATRGMLFDAVRELFAVVAESRAPVLLGIDDMQHCGDDALALLDHVSPVCDDGALMIAVTTPAPPADVRPAARDALGALAVRARSHYLAARPFDRTEISSCLAEVTGLEPSQELVSTVQARTGGNPFFTVEVARHLARGGTAAEALPNSVRDVVRSRLARLPASTRRYLRGAALLGHTFELSLLATAFSVQVTELAGDLEPAEADGLILPDETTGRYRFTHGIVADAVANELGPLPLRRLYDQLVTALITRCSDEPARWPHIAHLAVASLPVGDPLRADEWLAAAGRHAAATLALDDALRLYGQRLHMIRQLPRGPDAWRRELEVRTDMAVLLTWRAGQAKRAVGEQLEAALDLARRLGDSDAVARVSWGLWTHHSVRAELSRAEQLARELVGLAEQATDPSVLTIANIASAATAYQQGRHIDARAALERARDGLEALTDRHLAVTLVQHPRVHWAVFDAMVRWFSGDELRAWSSMRNAVDQAQSLGNPYTEQFARSFQLLLATIRDDVGWATAAAPTLLSTTGALGFEYTSTIAQAVMGWSQARQGDLGGIDTIRDALAKRARLEAGAGRPLVQGMLADSLLSLGRGKEALDACDHGLDDAARLGERYWEPELHRRRGAALELLGQRDAALAALHRAHEVATKQAARALLTRIERDLAATSRR